MNPRRADSTARRLAPTATSWLGATLLLAAGCSHDWSAAADADVDSAAPDVGDVPGELPDAPPDTVRPDGEVADTLEAGDADDGSADAPADDVVAPEDVAPEDVPPPDCVSDPDCDDDNTCTLDRCDPFTLTCTHAAQADDTSCGVGAICCAETCVSSLDVAHCGTCGNVCPGAPHATPVCGTDGCGVACEAGYLDCASSAAGCETTPADDEAHCGSCSAPCSDAETCTAGSCAPSWRPLSTVGEPSARRYVSGFWTGTEFLIFGGHAAGSCFTAGGAYNPATDSWRRMADAAGTLTGCTRAAAVWSGTALLVWGGASSAGDTTAEPGGGRYDPVADRWTAISPIGDPTERMSAAAVWTGTEMIVWGGARNPSAMLNDGGRYDPATDRWTAMSNVGAPTARWHPSAVWTGTELLVWGGFLNDFGAPTNTGGRYDPATDSWRSMSTGGAPVARGATPAVWTGTELLVWGGPSDAAFGTGYYDPLNDGGAYDPATDRWRPLAGAPLSARHGHWTEWTGRVMVAWGGTSDYGLLAYDDGALYDPTTDSWTPMTEAGAPRSRRNFAADWSGTEFLVWGGADQLGGLAVNLDDGGAYRPR